MNPSWRCPKCGSEDFLFTYVGHDDTLTATCNFCHYRESSIEPMDRGAVMSDADRDAYRDAYIVNARFHLDELTSLIHDGLTGTFDIHLRVSFLDAVAAISENLNKALV